ncbi:MAG: toprim domain-containing protein, partial [Phycisphaerales bacterium]|nr:toprim domain-containing protein [Phycisphaerales bacterium]
MANQLVIVESPAKAKTINRYLGPGFTVEASVGHVRDLPKSAKGQPVPGVDIENDFAPSYQPVPGKKKVITALRKLAKTADEVWFATDLDREGEAIAWHLAEELKIDPTKAKRVVFNAITKKQIEQAFEKPNVIDMDRVNAQQARRILDRIVGYQVSPLLWKRVAGGLSAGRVQSVAVRLIVEREKEIRAFVPDEFWQVDGCFALDPKQRDELEASWSTLHAEAAAAENPKPVTQKEQNRWLRDHNALSAGLVEVDGKRFNLKITAEGFEAVVDEKQAEEDAERILQGQFTLDDLLTQLKTIQKLGPIREVFAKMPMFNQMADQVEEDQLRVVESMIQSMTRHERKDPDQIDKSRIAR